MNWMWIAYALVVLVISGLIGLHLGRFTEAYTEMTGMMAGMTMGMLNGFLLGYAAAAATGMSMFWGNIFGVLLGLALGAYFGRAGGLMGIMDGGMGGVMGGSMGAMLAVMVAFPREGVYWTAGLLALLYIVGMLGLVALIEQSAPEHAALHRVLPMFTRAVNVEANEAMEQKNSRQAVEARGALQIPDYYAFLGVLDSAGTEEIGDAYLAKLAATDEKGVEQSEQALAILTDPRKREVYDRRLRESRAANPSDGRGACCPPRKKKASATVEDSPLVQATPTVSTAPAAPHGSTARGATRTATRPAALPAGTLAANARPAQARVTTPVTSHNKPKAAASKAKARSQKQNEMPVSWVGMLAVGVILVMLAAWWLTSQGVSQPVQASASQLESQAVTVPVAADGKQTVDFVVNGYTRSYEPKAIRVKKGVPVHFNISLKGPDAGCTRFIAIRDLDAHGVAVQNKATYMDFTPTAAGVFEINCEMRMTPPSYLIVTD